MNIVVYSMNNCVYCSRAKLLLQDKGLAYEERNAKEHIEYLKEKLSHLEKLTAPQIFVGGVHIGGYTELAAQINEIIRLNGLVI